MSYRRCTCWIGDIPHPTEAVHHKHSRRCTRVVAVEIRRVVDTKGRPVDGPWYGFCTLCAKSIQTYQGTQVETRPA